MHGWLLAFPLAYSLAKGRFHDLSFDQFAPIQPGINWEPCTDLGNNDPLFSCGRFEVPMDWADPNAGKASLAVIRYSAPAPIKLGYVFVNPGGPAHSGLMSSVEGRTKYVSDIARNAYDFISWDTRGTNNTYPHVDCFEDDVERASFFNGSTLQSGIQLSYHFNSRQDEINKLYRSVDEIDQKLSGLGRKCLQKHGDHLKYVGTAASARDLLAMADYLSPGKPVNLWLFSYATVIASHFVNMFPDRVGRVIMDGVVNPLIWTSKPAHMLWGYALQDAEYTLDTFFDHCIAIGPAGCALAGNKGSDRDTLREWMANLLDQLYEYHSMPGALKGLKPSRFRAWLINTMSWPHTWPSAARIMIEVEKIVTQGSFSHSEVGDDARNALESSLLDYRITYAAQGAQAITCGDAADDEGRTTKDVFDEIIRVTREVTPFMGARWDDNGLFCVHWPVRAVERYGGPWNRTLANRILILNNMADPYTSVASARSVVENLRESAIFVITQGIGHCSVSTRSKCADKIAREYLLNGILPAKDTVCPADFDTFPISTSIWGIVYGFMHAFQHYVFGACVLIVLLIALGVARTRRPRVIVYIASTLLPHTSDEKMEQHAFEHVH